MVIQLIDYWLIRVDPKGVGESFQVTKSTPGQTFAQLTTGQRSFCNMFFGNIMIENWTRGSGRPRAAGHDGVDCQGRALAVFLSTASSRYSSAGPRCACAMLTCDTPAPPSRSFNGLGPDGGTALAPGLERLTALQTLNIRWP
jgi:hypothetical protein